MSFKKLAAFLPAIAATVLAILVMPLAIEQYPEYGTIVLGYAWLTGTTHEVGLFRWYAG